MLAPPCREVEVMSLTPSTWMSASSSELDDVVLHDLGGGALPGHGDR